MPSTHFRLGELVRASDGFEGVIVHPTVGSVYEEFQALGEQFVVYTVLRPQSGEVRHFRGETLTPSTRA